MQKYNRKLSNTKKKQTTDMRKMNESQRQSE